MESKEKHVTASMRGWCSECGWPVVDACCNDEFADFSEQDPDSPWDWWVYCSNKGCVNHHGEGVYQERIEWWRDEEPNESHDLLMELFCDFENPAAADSPWCNHTDREYQRADCNRCQLWDRIREYARRNEKKEVDDEKK